MAERHRARRTPRVAGVRRRARPAGALAKLAGILVEGRPQAGWAVLGIGLNVGRPAGGSAGRAALGRSHARPLAECDRANARAAARRTAAAAGRARRGDPRRLALARRAARARDRLGRLRTWAARRESSDTGRADRGARRWRAHGPRRRRGSLSAGLSAAAPPGLALADLLAAAGAAARSWRRAAVAGPASPARSLPAEFRPPCLR